MFKFKMLAVASFFALLGSAVTPHEPVLSIEEPATDEIVTDEIATDKIVTDETVTETNSEASSEAEAAAPDPQAMPTSEAEAETGIETSTDAGVTETETDPAVGTGPAAPRTIEIEKTALYPEGIEYNPNTGKFLLSSVREGTIYEIDETGAYTPFIEDERLVSTTGIHIDAERNRLLVPNTDHGLSLHSDPERKLKMAELGIYNLTTGEPIAYVDLAALRPEGAHFANDVAVDAEGNAYVTDSVSPILYKVDPMGNASVFLENERFTGEGFNFNGIIYHPDGYLIVAKKNEGVLFKVPVSAPESFTEIQISQQFGGADGLVLADNNTLLLIANKVGDITTNAVIQLQGDQTWESAIVAGIQETGDVYPTTGIAKENEVYVVFGQLSGLGAALKEPEPTFADSFEIQQVGALQMVEDFLLN
ncbi:MAG: hypothetical protein AAF171_19670 [Cyanobacteria bacterium P01_A01_bin.116]